MTNVCVVGLGRIGLPLALILAKANHRVVGVDINHQRLDQICNNKLEERTAKLERILIEEFLEKKFFVTDDLKSALLESDVVFIVIGTGIRPDASPDLSNLLSLVEKICSIPDGVKDKLYIFKSTLPVGTTRNITNIIEKRTKMHCGKDFFIAFCPERTLGDKVSSEMKSLPKIIGGMDKLSTEKAVKIYKTIGGKIIIVQKPEAAELIKLMDNSYRQTMFAFANDISFMARKYNLNIYKLIKNANDNYPRNNIPLPSAGVSGYCLTKDPLYLEYNFKETAKKRGFSSIWYWARKTNDYMPTHIVDILRKKLRNLNKRIKGGNVLVCGISYKENIDDTRYSHGLEIAEKLKKNGANVFIWDPNAECKKLDFKIVKDPNEIINILDAMIFTVKHNEFIQLNDNEAIIDMALKMRTPIIVDGWGIFQEFIGRKELHLIGVGIPE